MKDTIDDAKRAFRDPDNRGLLKVAKWITVLLALGAIPGFAGIVVATMVIFLWKLPDKK